MRNINYILNDDNVIVEWHEIPFDSSKPHIKIANKTVIHVGVDKVIDGKLVQDSEAYEAWKVKHDRIVYLVSEISKEKAYLSSTDYLLYKYMEAELSFEEWEPTKNKRHESRRLINEYEKELEELRNGI